MVSDHLVSNRTMKRSFPLFDKHSKDLVLWRSSIGERVEFSKILQGFLIISQTFFTTDCKHPRPFAELLFFQMLVDSISVTAVARRSHERPRFVSYTLKLFGRCPQQFFSQETK